MLPHRQPNASASPPPAALAPSALPALWQRTASPARSAAVAGAAFGRGRSFDGWANCRACSATCRSCVRRRRRRDAGRRRCERAGAVRPRQRRTPCRLHRRRSSQLRWLHCRYWGPTRNSRPGRAGPGQSQIVLVGGGDPTLSGPAAVGPVSPATRRRRASRAGATDGRELLATGRPPSPRLRRLLVRRAARSRPGWKPIYQTEGDVAPVSALEVDEGHPRSGPDGEPPIRRRQRQPSSPLCWPATGSRSRACLPGRRRSGDAGTLRPSHRHRCHELVERMLGRSDNDLAEALPARSRSRLDSLRASPAARAVKAAIAGGGRSDGACDGRREWAVAARPGHADACSRAVAPGHGPRSCAVHTDTQGAAGGRVLRNV